MFMSKREPLENSINKRYGKLIVLEFTGDKNKRGEKIVRSICDCGNKKICLLRLIRRGTIRSCGCLKQTSSAENIKKAHSIFIEKEKWKDPLLRTQQSIFRLRYSDGNITFEMFKELSQQNCFYCNAPPSNKGTSYTKSGVITEERLKNSYFTYNGLDRIDSTRGHMIDNVVTCCADCNRSKSNRPQSEFLDWVTRVYIHKNLSNKT